MFRHIFSSFLNEEQFNFDTKLMKNKILKIKSNSPGRIVSNYGGWQSEAFGKIETPFENLFHQVNNIVQGIKQKLEIKNKIGFRNYWFNVNKLGSFNRPHYHPQSVISGVYYISVPQNSGKIYFENHTDVSMMYGEVNNFNEYNSSDWRYSPKENLCLLFPSYLKHYVEPNLNKKNRISISFNYGF